MTWWPPWSRRSVIPDPMRPRPISPNCIRYASNARLTRSRLNRSYGTSRATRGGRRPALRIDGLADLVKALGHLPQLDPQHPATMIPQRLKIAERLCLLQDAE